MKATLIIWKNWIKVRIHLVTHALFTCIFLNAAEAVSQRCLRCSIKKVFLKVSQESLENACGRVSFLIKALFRFLGNLNIINELLKLRQLKWQNRSLFYLISLSGISFSWFVLSKDPIYLDTFCFVVYSKINGIIILIRLILHCKDTWRFLHLFVLKLKVFNYVIKKDVECLD